jgi:HAD superfamily hydrolase (TIGR01509 family)
VFRKRKVDFTKEDFRHTFGQRNDAIITSVLGVEVARSELEAISHEKETNFRRSIGHRVQPLPGVVELVTSLKEYGFRMALASSAPVANIRLIVEGLGLDGYFQVIVSGEDVTEGKPNPQVFLLAAGKLGIKPRNCIVIEDAVAGVSAAKGAGMCCLAVTNTHPRASLEEADLVVDNLATVSVAVLERLLMKAAGEGGRIDNIARQELRSKWKGL